MSLASLRTLPQLQKECDELGLSVVPAGKRLSKTDCMRVLRDHFLSIRYPDGIPSYLQLMLSIDSPMLCARYSDLKLDEQDAIWNAPNYVAEVKENGVRIVVVFVEGKVHLFSRNNSVGDYLPVEYTDGVWLGDSIDYSKLPKSFIADFELFSVNPNISTVMQNRGVVSETSLQAVASLIALNPMESIPIQQIPGNQLLFKLFDVLYVNGVWITQKTQGERYPVIDALYKVMKAAGFNIEQVKRTAINRRAFYLDIINSGGEGVVIKDVNAPYSTVGNRGKFGWVKVKRSMSQTQGMGGDHVDAFVSGFELGEKGKAWENLVAVLHFSTNLVLPDGSERVHEIAHISGFTQEQREAWTQVNPDGSITLNPHYYGRVAEIDGVCVSARSHRLTHATFVAWRPDRSADTCKMEEQFLMSMIL